MKNSKYYPWVVVGLLWVVALLNYMDRQMLSTMKDAAIARGDHWQVTYKNQERTSVDSKILKENNGLIDIGFLLFIFFY